MKRIITICAALLMTASVFAQAPEKMSYQAVVRDGSNNLVSSTSVGMRIQILQGSEFGAAVYVETQTPTSNANGLVSIEIGTGTVVIGDFSTIDWADGPYFIKTETDPDGGTNYSITGTSQLLSVPYALHAKTAETVTGSITETDPVFEASPAADIETSDIGNWNEAYDWGDHSAEGYATKDMDGEKITNLADPTDAQDAATKSYVDENLPATYEIGDEAHGGIVFYVEPCGTKGLVAATEDQSTGIKWRGGNINYATMSRGDGLYAGKMNTSIIIAVHAANGDLDNHAALICANYKGGDFGDWYLPSREELILMRDNLQNHNPSLGNFANSWYWSSSEHNSSIAWSVNFLGGPAQFDNKFDSGRVRAIRAF